MALSIELDLGTTRSMWKLLVYISDYHSGRDVGAHTLGYMVQSTCAHERFINIGTILRAHSGCKFVQGCRRQEA
jgi:hypothetical protein